MIADEALNYVYMFKWWVSFLKFGIRRGVNGIYTD